MIRYKHIFFDLDHTLWDFDKNCAETLDELYHLYELGKYGVQVDRLIDEYQKVNHAIWQEYNLGNITKEVIRNKRFEITFSNLGLSSANIPPEIDNEFLKRCPARGNLFPHALDVLTYLQKKYDLHIITNGFEESQKIKIRTSGLEPFFNHVINSEVCGFSKPDRQIFEYALQKVNAECHECIMIGDDLEADIKGAQQMEMDHVLFNPHKRLHTTQVMHEINCLSELYTLL